jgi:hypothetical protein
MFARRYLEHGLRDGHRDFHERLPTSLVEFEVRLYDFSNMIDTS